MLYVPKMHINYAATAKRHLFTLLQNTFCAFFKDQLRTTGWPLYFTLHKTFYSVNDVACHTALHFLFAHMQLGIIAYSQM